MNVLEPAQLQRWHQLRGEYEARVKAVEGRILTEVVYYELQWEGKEAPAYDWLGKDLDALDFGLDLVTDVGETFGIIWEWDFFQYHVGIHRQSLDELVTNASTWSVAERWGGLIGQEITLAKLWWSSADIEGAVSTEREVGPQTLELRFESERSVYVSALEVDATGKRWGGADNLVVVWNEGLAEEYEIGPYGDSPDPDVLLP
jgi:hypothetical protein